MPSIKRLLQATGGTNFPTEARHSGPSLSSLYWQDRHHSIPGACLPQLCATIGYCSHLHTQAWTSQLLQVVMVALCNSGHVLQSSLSCTLTSHLHYLCDLGLTAGLL